MWLFVKNFDKPGALLYRFASGSVIPFNASRKRLPASTALHIQSICWYESRTDEIHLYRSKTIVDKMQYNCFPIALCSRTAATATVNTSR